MIQRTRPAADEYREIAGRFTALVEGVPRRRAPGSSAGPGPRSGPPATSSAISSSGSPPSSPAARASPCRRAPASTTTRVAAWRMHERRRAGPSSTTRPSAEQDADATRTSARSRCPRRVSRFCTADVFMHTWDLARATGQDETLDPERCASAARRDAAARRPAALQRPVRSARSRSRRRRRRAALDAATCVTTGTVACGTADPVRAGHRGKGQLLAEADGNRTRLTEILGHVGFEDRGGHQTPRRLPADLLPPGGRAGRPRGGVSRQELFAAFSPSGVTAAHSPPPTPCPAVAPGCGSPL